MTNLYEYFQASFQSLQAGDEEEIVDKVQNDVNP